MLEFSDLADLLEGKDLIFLVPVDSKTCGIVSPVFQAGETCEGSVPQGVRVRRGFVYR